MISVKKVSLLRILFLINLIGTKEIFSSKKNIESPQKKQKGKNGDMQKVVEEARDYSNKNNSSKKQKYKKEEEYKYEAEEYEEAIEEDNSNEVEKPKHSYNLEEEEVKDDEDVENSETKNPKPSKIQNKNTKESNESKKKILELEKENELLKRRFEEQKKSSEEIKEKIKEINKKYELKEMELKDDIKRLVDKVSTINLEKEAVKIERDKARESASEVGKITYGKDIEVGKLKTENLELRNENKKLLISLEEEKTNTEKMKNTIIKLQKISDEPLSKEDKERVKGVEDQLLYMIKENKKVQEEVLKIEREKSRLYKAYLPIKQIRDNYLIISKKDVIQGPEAIIQFIQTCESPAVTQIFENIDTLLKNENNKK